MKQQRLLWGDYTFKTKEPSRADYQRFLDSGLQKTFTGKEMSVRYDFADMMRIFGNSYVFWLEMQFAVWRDPDNRQSFLQLCRDNGNVPPKFFDKFSKDSEE